MKRKIWPAGTGHRLASCATGGRISMGRFVASGAIMFALLATALPSSPANAQGLRFIRDAEIEDLLADYSRPILRAAGLNSRGIKVRIIRNSSFNAFVLDGRNIFMNSGSLSLAATPNEVIGVIAHETGHIAGGHLAGLRAKIKRDSTRLILAKILGIGAIIAAGSSSSDSTKDVVGGIGKTILGASDPIVVRSILSYRRVQESSADQAAVQYLEATGQSAQGMIVTFERFTQQEYFSARLQDQYARSHPIAQQRLAQLRGLARKSRNFRARDSRELQLRHDLMRAKLSGYLDRPATVLNRYPPSDTSLPAAYARAIASFFSGGLNASLPQIERLIRAKPNNPYFWELKGELLIRGGRAAEAVAPLKKALALHGDQPLIQIRLGQAMIASKNPQYVDPAIRTLRKALVVEKSALAYRLLATAHEKKGQRAHAELASAQAYFFEGRVKNAQDLAKRAQLKFKRGTAQWVQADDILKFTPKER